MVDYICTYHDNLDNCKYFNVHLMRSLLDKIGTFTDKIPDHSVLEFDFLQHYAGIENNIDMSVASNLQNVTDIPQSNNDETTQRYFIRYNVRNMPADFLKCDVAQ